MAVKTVGGEIEANPAKRYEDHDGPQRVGAHTGTAYPIPDESSPPAPKAQVQQTTPSSKPKVTKKKGSAK